MVEYVLTPLWGLLVGVTSAIGSLIADTLLLFIVIIGVSALYYNGIALWEEIQQWFDK